MKGSEENERYFLLLLYFPSNELVIKFNSMPFITMFSTDFVTSFHMLVNNAVFVGKA